MNQEIDPAVLDELTAKYQRVKVIPYGEHVWVFRKPSSAEYKMFRAKSHNPASAPTAQEDLARVTVVHPSRAAFDAFLEEYPGFCENPDVTKALGQLTGMTEDDHVKRSGTPSTPSGASPTTSLKG